MSERLRILLLVRKLDIGGAQRQAALLARGLAARGHDVAIAALYPGGDVARDLAGAPVRLLDLGKEGRGDVVGFGARLLRLLRAEKPDVLYSFLTVPNLLSAAAHTLSPRPLIVWGVRASNMDMSQYDRLSRWTAALEPRVAGAADLVIANARQAAEDAAARGFPKSRIVVVPNGVDAVRFYPDAAKRAAARARWGVGEGEIVVGHAGRADPMKDHATFFAAMAQVREGLPAARGVCVVAGGEEERARLRGEAGDVLIVDDGGEIAAALNGFDVFCSSSAYGEAFSNVVIEALATGLPCAATRVGDAFALIGDAGALAPPRDPAALAAAIRAVIEARANLASRALARAAAFTPEALAAATEAHILAARARR